MTLSAITIQLTGYLNPSVREDSAIGLRISRIGLFHVTDTGEHHSISGNVSAATESAWAKERSLRI